MSAVDGGGDFGSPESGQLAALAGELDGVGEGGFPTAGNVLTAMIGGEAVVARGISDGCAGVMGAVAGVRISHHAERTTAIAKGAAQSRQPARPLRGLCGSRTRRGYTEPRA
jgi:hypothetical protein